MGLKLVIGKSKVGKSRYIYEQIAKQKGRKALIITPEQFSFSAEKRLLAVLGKDAEMSCEVITLSRMADRLAQEIGDPNVISLSKAGRAMLLYQIMTKQKQEITFLGNHKENIEMISNFITELKRHQVSLEELEELEQNVEDLYLKRKLKDLLLVLKEFESQIQERYIEQDDKLTLAIPKIAKSKLVQGAEVYIDEFAGFTKQEYGVISAILQKANNVTITVTSDNLEISTSPEQDIFYQNKKTIQKLEELAVKHGIKIESKVLLPEDSSKQEDLEHLEKQLRKPMYQKYEKEVRHIRLYLAKDPYSEIEYLAKDIVEKVRKKRLSFFRFSCDHTAARNIWYAY